MTLSRGWFAVSLQQRSWRRVAVIECDVLVAGTGAGGFAAALAARLEGLDVIMVEKEPLFGGTTAYSAGVIWIPNNHHLAKAGLSDSREAALRYLQSHVGNRLDKARAEAFVDTAPVMLKTFEAAGFVAYTLAPTWADYHPTDDGGSDGGRSLTPDDYDGRALGDWFDKLRPPLASMVAFGGMMVGRTDLPHVFRMTKSVRSAAHVARMTARFARDRLTHKRGTRLVNGNGLIARMARHALDRGVRLWLSSPVQGLDVEGGRVVGATVFRDGQDIQVRARKGVVLATGGFPHNAALTSRLYGHIAEGRQHTHLPPRGNAGDGVRLAETAGGFLSDNVHQVAAWAPVSQVPQADGTTVPYPHFVDRGKPGIISVDKRGWRFVNEAQSYHVFMPALFEACRRDKTAEAWIIADHKAIRRFGLGAIGPQPMPLRPHLASGYLKRGETPEALAKACGIDPNGLAETIRAFNGPAREGRDPAFNRGSDAYQRFNGAPDQKPNPSVAPLETPPYYAVRVVAGELGTFAGIATNANAQVVGRDGGVVDGLYAVGNDALSVMGGTYPGGGITIGPAMTFGYIAARHMAGSV
jgi:succinate dehydrogenase/fumarate reductase flavoprotein subunit